MDAPTAKGNFIRAELQGGVGNQLFVLGAGLAQAIRLNVPLVLDAKMLEKSTSRHVKRELEIEPLLKHLDFPIDIDQRRLSSAGQFYRQLLLRLPTSKYFREPSLNYSATIDQCKPKQTLSGYFQSHLYFSHGSAELMRDALLQLAAEKGILPSPEIYMHIRRGDYLLARHQSHHGIASLEYFDSAVTLFRKLNKNIAFRIFTDSPNLIPETLIERWGATLDEKQLELSPLDALLNLASNSGIIMSNSSFSWWAAWLSQKRNPDVMVIAPRPWLADGFSAHTLLPKNWISLGV